MNLINFNNLILCTCIHPKEKSNNGRVYHASIKNYNNIISIVYSHSLPGVLEKEKKYTDLYLGPYWMGRGGGKMLGN